MLSPLIGYMINASASPQIIQYILIREIVFSIYLSINWTVFYFTKLMEDSPQSEGRGRKFDAMAAEHTESDISDTLNI